MLHEKSHVKYRVFRCVTGMHIDTGCDSPLISVAKTFYWGISWSFDTIPTGNG